MLKGFYTWSLLQRHTKGIIYAGEHQRTHCKHCANAAVERDLTLNKCKNSQCLVLGAHEDKVQQSRIRLWPIRWPVSRGTMTLNISAPGPGTSIVRVMAPAHLFITFLQVTSSLFLVHKQKLLCLYAHSQQIEPHKLRIYQRTWNEL